MSNGPSSTWPVRIGRALRMAIVAGAALAAVGLVDRYESWPLLTSTLGPTAYLFAAHPESISSRWRNAALGHGAAVGVSLVFLAVFGLWHEPSEAIRGHVTLAQVVATAAAVCTTLVILELINTHHAPAAATVVLITTGLARPGRPLIGLVAGMAIVIALSPLLGWGPSPRQRQL